MFKSICLVALAAVAVLAMPSSKIETRLANTLAAGKTANVLVQMRERTGPVLDHLSATATFTTRNERLNAVPHALMSHADKTQAKVRSFLTEAKAEFKIFWITNQLYVLNAGTELIEKLASFPEVAEITEEFEVHLDEPIKARGPAPPRQNDVEWGINTIEAPACWAAGFTGAGVKIASIDTGGYASHPDLMENFAGTNYGWRDVTLFGTQTPRDDNGHGTHTIGTFAGKNGVGVASDAKWMACKALNAQGSGTNAGLIECGQWVDCPTLPNGFTPNCTMAPHIVSNSWGGGQQNFFYNDVINAWHASGIIPVFANGNSGPDCGTANSPADSLAGVIGVGATDNTDSIAYFSSKGPTVGGRQKPDISAPGHFIRSCWHTQIDGDYYNTISGTSMATPHVSGGIAILLQRFPNITYAQVTGYLNQNTNTNITNSGAVCGSSIDETMWPNYSFGYGILNIRKALGIA